MGRLEQADHPVLGVDGALAIGAVAVGEDPLDLVQGARAAEPASVPARELERLQGDVLDVARRAADREPGVEPASRGLEARLVQQLLGRVVRGARDRLVVDQAVHQRDQAFDVIEGRLRVGDADLQRPEAGCGRTSHHTEPRSSSPKPSTSRRIDAA
jgi:hypothetical protein